VLTRAGVGLFRAPVGSVIRIVGEPRRNNGTDAVSYRYNQQDVSVPSSSCRFTVVAGRKVFKGQAVWGGGAGQDAAYELFQLDADGNRRTLDERVSLAQNGPEGLFAFNIEAPGAVLAAAPRTKAAARKKKTDKSASRRHRKTKPAVRKTARTRGRSGAKKARTRSKRSR